MTRIELRQISNFILKKVSLEIPSYKTYVLIGPNGAGKTTILKVIAGLVNYRGNVLFDGRPVDDLPPWKRNVGYVPQSNALFPHMTVEENILFGLKVKGVDENSARKIVKEYMEIADITHLKNRYPLTLSGGEQKKVAIIRALVNDPKILLLDEPFTGLHYDTRIQLVEVLRNIKKQYNKTVILVTHDLDEALELGDYYGILVNGRILYSGNKYGFLNSVNKYLGYVNALECNVEKCMSELGLCKVSCSKIPLIVPWEGDLDNINRKLIVSVQADKLIVYRVEEQCPSINCIQGEVYSISKLQNDLQVIKVNTDLDVTLNIISSCKVSVGEKVFVNIPLKYIRTYVLKENRGRRSQSLNQYRSV